ncbi:copper resistance CopC family protein [Micromonospora sp. M12]
MSRAGRLGVAALTVLLALLVPAGPAWAHNTLRSSSPARDATLPGTPSAVTLEFSARLDPGFTTVVLTDADKRRIPTGDPVVVGATSTVAVTGALPNGTYTVAYRVVSTDGHPLQGSYPFSVADPRRAPRRSAAPARRRTPSVRRRTAARASASSSRASCWPSSRRWPSDCGSGDERPVAERAGPPAR